MRVGLVTDIHWAADPQATGGWHNAHDFKGVPARLAAAFDWLAERDVDLVAIGGDLAHRGDVESLAAVLEACSGAGAPVGVVAGNHDVSRHRDGLRLALTEASASAATLLTGAGVVSGGVRVAGIHVGATDGWFGARLREPPPVAAWERDPVVLVSHFPLLSRAALISEHGFPYPGDLLDRREAADPLLARAEPTVVLSGHIHARASHASGPVLQLSQGALAEAPYECAMVEVTRADDGIVRVWRESGRLAHADIEREPVFAPALETWSFDGARWRVAAEDHETTPDRPSRPPQHA